MLTPKQRLRELGLTLPEPPAALASYVPATLAPLDGRRGLLYIAGQVPLRDAKPAVVGKVPSQVGVEQAQEAARICALNILAQVEAASGLDNVERVLQVTGFVLSDDGFGDQPKVMNAASELIAEVLGESGKHARIAVGTNALPMSVSVEVAAVLLVRTG
jgi:enamine deaminase RidA (YjgF/YER057c/UK114 family)